MLPANIARAVLLAAAVAVPAPCAPPDFSIKAIAAGASRSLALASDGTVWEWGQDWQPQWGGPVPTRVDRLSGVVTLAGASNYNLEIKEDGSVWAWGGGWSGGELAQYSAPVPRVGLTGVVAIAGGLNHTLALKRDGTVMVVGYNFSGELGNGTTTNSAIPVPVSNLTGVVAIAAGNQRRRHRLGLLCPGANGHVHQSGAGRCWSFEQYYRHGGRRRRSLPWRHEFCRRLKPQRCELYEQCRRGRDGSVAREVNESCGEQVLYERL